MPPDFGASFSALMERPNTAVEMPLLQRQIRSPKPLGETRLPAPDSVLLRACRSTTFGESRNRGGHRSMTLSPWRSPESSTSVQAPAVVFAAGGRCGVQLGAFAATADDLGWSRSLHRRAEVLIGKCGYRRFLDHDNGAVIGPVANIARRCQLLVSLSELVAVLGLDCSAKRP
jgi:hypothetical protein